MQSNTISVTPIPLGTTQEQIRSIFHAFSVKNVYINFPTAYVEFHDEGDLENLDIQFDNYEVADLNNAKIDKADFNWSSIHKESTSPDKKSDSSSSDKHQDLMAADIDHLVIVENCDQLFLKNLSEETIKELFKGFHSINRIIKRRKDVIVEFTDPAQLEQLQNRFPGFNIPELGWNSSIEKADSSKITASQFVQEWSKDRTKDSVLTQATTHLGYEDKSSSGGLPKEKKSQIGYGQKPASQQLLHQDIIPPFDKKTSMEVNFLNEQSKVGQIESKHQKEPIHEATTNQQLDYTTEIKISNQEEQDRFELGYEAAEKQRLAQNERKRKQEERIAIKRREEEERKKKEEQQKQRYRREEEQRQRERIRRAEEQRQRERERIRRQEAQRERERQLREQRERKEQEQRQIRARRQEQERQENIRREQEEVRRRQEQERKRREQEQTRAAQQLRRKRIQQERLSQELREKMEVQRTKYKKEEQERRQSQLGYHESPTDTQIINQQARFIEEIGKPIEQQLGYAVNKAKQQSVNLVNAGLNLLRQQTNTRPQQKFGYEKPQIKDKKTDQLGYEPRAPQQVAFDLLNSSMAFLKESYNKIQTTIGAISKEVSNPSELGYEKWTSKPEVQLSKPLTGKNPRLLKTLVTISLFIWVIFLLMQDTCQDHETVTIEREVELPTAEVIQQEIPVSTNQNI